MTLVDAAECAGLVADPLAERLRVLVLLVLEVAPGGTPLDPAEGSADEVPAGVDGAAEVGVGVAEGLVIDPPVGVTVEAGVGRTSR